MSTANDLRFTGLPTGVLAKISSHLPPSSLQNLTCSSHRFAYGESSPDHTSNLNCSPLWKDAYSICFGAHTREDTHSWPRRFYLRHLIRSHWLYSTPPCIQLESRRNSDEGASFITSTEDALHIARNSHLESTVLNIPLSSLPDPNSCESNTDALSPSWNPPESITTSYPSPITAISSAPIFNSSSLPLATEDGRIHLHALRDMDCEARLPGGRRPRRSLTLRTRLYNITHMAPLSLNEVGSGSRLAVGDTGGTIRIVDTQNPSSQRFMSGHFYNPVSALCTLRSGLLVAAGGDETQLYDVETGQSIGQIRVEREVVGIEAVKGATNAEEPLVYVASSRGIHLWDTRMKGIAAVLEASSHLGRIKEFQVAPDETVYARAAGRILVWDSTGSWMGRTLGDGLTHFSDLTCMRVQSESGKDVVLGGCKDGSIQVFSENGVTTLWKARRGRKRRRAVFYKIVTIDACDWVFFSSSDAQVSAIGRGGPLDWDSAHGFMSSKW